MYWDVYGSRINMNEPIWVNYHKHTSLSNKWLKDRPLLPIDYWNELKARYGNSMDGPVIISSNMMTLKNLTRRTARTSDGYMALKHIGSKTDTSQIEATAILCYWHEPIKGAKQSIKFYLLQTRMDIMRVLVSTLS